MLVQQLRKCEGLTLADSRLLFSSFVLLFSSFRDSSEDQLTGPDRNAHVL